MPFKNCVSEALNWVSTKTLVLKHYYLRQGKQAFLLRKKPVNGEEISEAFAREKPVNGEEISEAFARNGEKSELWPLSCRIGPDRAVHL